MSRHITNITQAALKELIERQGYRCALTGRPLTPEIASLDHRIPASRGGQHCISNTWVVHVDANRAKGTMTVDEFVRLCSEVVRHLGGNVR